MIKTLNPYSDTAKTAEIMSRYRPIAPRPESSANGVEAKSSMSEKIRQSPYLRNFWQQLQARPTRTRKRGRAAVSPPVIKRPRTLLGFTSPSHLTSAAKHFSLEGFAHGISHISVPNLAALKNSLESPVNAPSNLVTLPLLPCPASVPVVADQAAAPELSVMETSREEIIDLNVTADVPEEKDLLQQLRESPIPTSNVIAPQPVRPVGSSISVGCINGDNNSSSQVQVPKKPEEVEEEVESEALPVVVTDSSNKVRLANSAYKEMVGQPECLWLDSMVTSDGRPKNGKRICGEVTIQLSDSRVPTSSNGFSCWVRIDWGSEGKKNSVKAFCDVIRLSCKTKDYLFAWRFHTHSREGSQTGSNA